MDEFVDDDSVDVLVAASKYDIRQFYAVAGTAESVLLAAAAAQPLFGSGVYPDLLYRPGCGYARLPQDFDIAGDESPDFCNFFLLFFLIFFRKAKVSPPGRDSPPYY